MKDFVEIGKQYGYKYNFFLYYWQGAKDVCRYCIFGMECNILFKILKLFPKQRKLAVSKDTEITIEGFPGSGNSFAVKAFEYAQGRSIKIAHHLHLPCQIIESVKRNIPTLVLVRNPIDTIVSMISRTFISRYSYFYADPKLLFRYYVKFYKKILPVIDFIVIADFDDVIKDFGKIIKKINIKYGSSFSLFQHTQENVQKVLASNELRLARPMEFRKELKKKVKKMLLQEPRYKSFLSEACEIYHKVKEKD